MRKSPKESEDNRKTGMYCWDVSCVEGWGVPVTVYNILGMFLLVVLTKFSFREKNKIIAVAKQPIMATYHLRVRLFAEKFSVKQFLHWAQLYRLGER